MGIVNEKGFEVSSMQNLKYVATYKTNGRKPTKKIYNPYKDRTPQLIMYLSSKVTNLPKLSTEKHSD